MTTPPLHHLFHPDHVADYVATMRTGVEHLAAQLTGIQRPVTGRTPAEAAATVAAVDLDTPLGDTGAALAEMSRLWLDDAVWFHEPAYAAHLNCPVVIPALLGELFIAAVNSSMDTFDQSVGGTFVERQLIEWTGRRIGWVTDGVADGAASCDGVFTSGGTQSNLQALLLARGQAAARGVEPARMRIFASTDSHFSVQKSARILGLGASAVIAVETDDRRRMSVAGLTRALAACVAEGLVPMAVVATAGTTDFGAVDPLVSIGELCRRYDTWLHVDAAYGGGLLASQRRGHLLAGIDRADSVTVDYHKTFFQPVSSSALLVRDGVTLRHVTWHADYLNPRETAAAPGGSPNQVDKSLQTTRRFDALKLWLTLRIMGPDLIGEYFDTAIDLAHTVHERLSLDDDFELAGAPGLSTVVFRYRPEGLAPVAVDALNRRIRAALWSSGRAVVAATRVDGRQYLKFTLLNPMATLDDILAIVELVRSTGAELADGTAPAAAAAPVEVAAR